MFRYSADRIPTLIAFVATIASFVVYFTIDDVWWLVAFGVAMSPLRGAMGAWSHHHQHCFTFKSTALNRLLELCHFTQTGIATHLWVLHHVFGHHLNFLDQTKDESRWKRKSGKTMGMWEYILNVTFTSYWRAYQVGKRHPKQQRVYLTWSAISFAMLAALVAYKPLAALIVFVIPMVVGLMWVVWATYDHHAGLDTDDHWQGSYNIENKIYNLISCNLGYHTAHHYKQGVHWSKLPELHAQIRDRIPEHLFVKSSFDAFFPNQ
jgi:fatty acid desaturase